MERKFPKEAFDSEYSTEFLREMRFLSSKGIRYEFVRKTPEYGLSQFKYKKTPALFAALVEFYSRIEAERDVKVSSEEIKKAQQILEKAVQQNVIKPSEPEEKDDTI